MALRKGLPAKLAATDADDTRYDLSGLIVCNTDGTPRGGVLSPVGVNLVTATATMNVSVARFQGAAVRDAGVVLLANDGPTNVLPANAPAANSRLDVVYAKQNDASGTVSVPDANNLPAFGVLQGAAAPIPVRNPAGLPAGAVELATVQIPSTATATNSPGVVITQTAQFTAAAGGVVQFRTKAELDLWTTAPPQQRALDLATGIAYRREGAAWIGYSVSTLAPAAGVVLTAGSSIVKDENGIVTITIEATKAAGFNTNGDILTLPVGFRPAVPLAGDAYTTAGAFASVAIPMSGALSLYSPPAVTVIRMSKSFKAA